MNSSLPRLRPVHFRPIAVIISCLAMPPAAVIAEGAIVPHGVAADATPSSAANRLWVKFTVVSPWAGACEASCDEKGEVRYSLKGRSGTFRLEKESLDRFRKAATAYLMRPCPFLVAWGNVADAELAVVEVSVNLETRVSALYSWTAPPEMRSIAEEFGLALASCEADLRQKLDEMLQKFRKELPASLEPETGKGLLLIPNAAPEALVGNVLSYAAKRGRPWSDFWTTNALSVLAHLRFVRIGDILFATYVANPELQKDLRLSILDLSISAGCTRGMSKFAPLLRSCLSGEQEYLSELTTAIRQFLGEAAVGRILNLLRESHLSEKNAQKVWEWVLSNEDKLIYVADSFRFQLRQP